MTFDCLHLLELADADVEAASAGCAACEAIGSWWVHLRRCQSCGHVGCCDQSPNRHATKHFRTSGHPVVRSFEPDEAWSWCYVDAVGYDPDWAAEEGANLA